MAVNAAPPREAPPGRLAGRWVPWLVIGLWLALAAVMVPLSGKLNSVTTDKAVDTLPASAESTKVAVLGRRMWWPSRLSRPTAEPPNGQQALTDDEEPALQR